MFLIPVIYLLVAIVLGVALGALVMKDLVGESSFARLTFAIFSPANIMAILFSVVVSYWPLRWVWRKFD